MDAGTAGPASVVLDSADAAVRAGMVISDPIQRASALEDAMFNARTAVVARLAAARRDAIAEARQTKSAQQIADEMGISRSRVYQMLEGTDGPL